MSLKIGAGSSPNAGWPTDVGPSRTHPGEAGGFRAWLKSDSVKWVAFFMAVLLFEIL